MPESRGIREDSSVGAASRRVEVALLAGRRAPQTLIYAVPDRFASDVRAGTAVIAPLGPRQVTGIVLGPTTAEPPGRLRELTDVLHQALPRELLELALWAARYYRASRTALLQAALPQALRRSRRRRVVPVASDACDSRALRHPLDRAILARLPADGLALETLREELGAGVDGALKRLRARGALRVEDVAIARREPRHPIVAGDPTREPPPRARKQREIHGFVSTRAPHPVPREELEERFPGSSAVVARMLAAGALRAVPAAAAEAPAAGPPFPLHPEQEAAVEAIDAARGSFTPFLLHGVTGSGKTEVYLEAAARARRRGAGVLVLVPEIGLTPQLVEHARRRFGDRTQVLHSGLPEGERAQAWRAVAATDGAVVIGARSAVFAPLRALGLVVVDEEHDSAYKQEESPRYHARDVAVMRAKLAGCPVVLASATPSLESYHATRRGRYRLIELPVRANRTELPSVEIIDLRARRSDPGAAESPPPSGSSGPAQSRPPSGSSGSAESPPPSGSSGPAQSRPPSGSSGPAQSRPPSGSSGPAQSLPPSGSNGPARAHDPESPLSPALAAAVVENFRVGSQTLLFLNRRGFARFIQCEACGHVETCSDCSVSLTLHRARRAVVCHHCGFAKPPATRCPECGTPLQARSHGTEQVEVFVRALLPAARVARLDSDTSSSASFLRETVAAWRRGTLDVLVGTQMVAKGHDAPGVTLIGVVLADTSLSFPDFRAAERTFQLLAQVAGRAGRGALPGRVLVQTRQPDHPSLIAARRHDYAAFAEAELALRSLLLYPPFGRIARIVVEGEVLADVERRAESVAARLRRGTTPGASDAQVLGPAPAAIERLRGRHRQQVLVKATSAPRLAALLDGAALRDGVDADLRVIVDVDPISML